MKGKRAMICGLMAVMTAMTIFSATAKDNKNSGGINTRITNAMSDSIGLDGMENKIRRYMQEWRIKGASLAIMRNDSLVYAKGFGWADQAKGLKMQPSNLLRIASVSKLITATGIMVLQEQGKLSLKDTVFGPGGILNDEAFTKAISDRNCFRITVEDLLRHKGGFTTGKYGDPMFTTRSIISLNHLSKAPDAETLIPIVLKRPLGFIPGKSQSYSNFGFLLLSRIIEKTSGMSYEDFITEYVLKPAGCVDFHIANNYYKDKYPAEVRYYVPTNEKPVPEFNNSGRRVTRCYGGNNITALSGAGAWVASTPELARFVGAIDGKPGIPDVISRESLDAMIEYFDEDTFSLGWNDTKPESGWTRSGTFSGTSALVKYFPDGECWILVTNTSTWKGPTQSKLTATLFSELRSQYSGKLPARNLFKAE